MFTVPALEFLLPSGTDRWIGLLLEPPDLIAGTYVECADSEYTRIAHDAWSNTDLGDGRAARVNSGAIVFNGLVDADETTIPWWGIFVEEEGGHLLVAGPILNSDGEEQPLIVATNNQPRFDDGDLKLLSSEA